VYAVTVSWQTEWKKQVVYTSVTEYEIADGVLTLAFDADHGLVIPLYHVESVDIQRETRAGACIPGAGSLERES
jgi:hypothetical protein